MSTPAEGVGMPHYAASGVLIADRYQLSRRIAGGGMGEVWRAYDRQLDEPVAIKLLRLEYLEEPAFLERFRAEARLTGKLRHPGIAGVRGYGETGGPGGAAWLVMELVEGEPLSALLHRYGALPPERALDILGQAALALQSAHDAGVIHRDVKPANVLIRFDGQVKITDFGIARATGAAPLTRTGTVVGTAHYIAPEQVVGHRASAASDVYALGIVAYECLAGHRPFDGDSPVAVALAHQRDPVPPLPPELPLPVRALVLRALAKDPADRPASAGSFGRTALGIREALYVDTGDTGADDTAPPPAPDLSRPPRPEPTPPGHTGLTPPASGRSGAGRPWRPRRWRLPQLVLLALVATVAIVALVRGCAAGTDSDPATKTPASGTATTPGTATGASAGDAGGTGSAGGATAGTISLDPLHFRGQPVTAVLAELTTAGLVPRPVETAAEGAAGTVVTIVGADGGPLPARLHAGDTVLVQVVAARAPGAVTGSGTGQGSGINQKGSD